MGTDVSVRGDFGLAEKSGRKYLAALFRAGLRVATSGRGEAEMVWAEGVKYLRDAAERGERVPFEVPSSPGAISKVRHIARYFVRDGGMSCEDLAGYASNVNGWTVFDAIRRVAEPLGMSGPVALAAWRRGELELAKPEVSSEENETKPDGSDELYTLIADYLARGGSRDEAIGWFRENMPQ